MLFKTAIFLSLSIFSLFTSLYGMERTDSQNSLDSFVLVGKDGEDFQGGKTHSSPSPHDSTVPSAQTHAITPPKSPMNQVPPLAIPLSQAVQDIAAPTPTTPKSSSKSECEQTGHQESDESSTAPHPAPLELVQFHHYPAEAQPQMIPVEPFAPPTPSSALPTITAALVLAPKPLEPLALASQTQAAPPLQSPRPSMLSAQESATLKAAVETLRSPQKTPPQKPAVAQHPMKLSSEPRKETHAIDIAPESPGIKKPRGNTSEQETNCCIPLSCCGKQIFSGNIPTCPCPIKGCVIL